MGMNIRAFDRPEHRRLTRTENPDEDEEDVILADSEEYLERKAQTIRSELRVAEMTELVWEAERAAEAGDDHFAAQASTYGLDDTELLASAITARPHLEYLRRRASVPEITYVRRLRRRDVEKVGVLDLRAVDEVIPSFGLFHNHLRTHFARHLVDDHTLVHREAELRSRKTIGSPHHHKRTKSFLDNLGLQRWMKNDPKYRDNDTEPSFGDVLAEHLHDSGTGVRRSAKVGGPLDHELSDPSMQLIASSHKEGLQEIVKREEPLSPPTLYTADDAVSGTTQIQEPPSTILSPKSLFDEDDSDSLQVDGSSSRSMSTLQEESFSPPLGGVPPMKVRGLRGRNGHKCVEVERTGLSLPESHPQHTFSLVQELSPQPQSIARETSSLMLPLSNDLYLRGEIPCPSLKALQASSLEIPSESEIAAFQNESQSASTGSNIHADACLSHATHASPVSSQFLKRPTVAVSEIYSEFMENAAHFEKVGLRESQLILGEENAEDENKATEKKSIRVPMPLICNHLSQSPGSCIASRNTSNLSKAKGEGPKAIPIQSLKSASSIISLDDVTLKWNPFHNKARNDAKNHFQFAMKVLSELSPRPRRSAVHESTPKAQLVDQTENDLFLHNYLYCSESVETMHPDSVGTSELFREDLGCGNTLNMEGCCASVWMDGALQWLPRKASKKQILLSRKPSIPSRLQPQTWFDVANEKFDGVLERLVGTPQKVTPWNLSFQAPSLEKKRMKHVTVRRSNSVIDEEMDNDGEQKDEDVDDQKRNAAESPLQISRPLSMSSGLFQRMKQMKLSSVDFEIAYGIPRENFEALTPCERLQIERQVRLRRPALLQSASNIGISGNKRNRLLSPLTFHPSFDRLVIEAQSHKANSLRRTGAGRYDRSRSTRPSSQEASLPFSRSF
jgi:hypothetical protein